MTDIQAAIRDAFEHTEYDLGDVAVNRQQVRVPVLQRLRGESPPVYGWDEADNWEPVYARWHGWGWMIE